MGSHGKTTLYWATYLEIGLHVQEEGRTNVGTAPILVGSVGVVRDRKRSMSEGCESCGIPSTV